MTTCSQTYEDRLEALVSSSGIDARVKIAVLAVYSVCIFFVESWEGILAFLLLAVAFCIVFKPKMSKLLKLGTIIYVIAAFTIFFNMFAFSNGGFAFSLDGLYRGIFFAARIILLVMASLVVCMTCDPLALSAAFRSYLSPLSKIKVPVDDIATILSITLRFIPLTAKEYLSIKEAQWSRGANFDEGPIIGRIKSHCSILIPLFINMFRKADVLAMSMDARGYGISTIRRVDINCRKLDARSLVFGAACCTASVLIAIFL